MPVRLSESCPDSVARSRPRSIRSSIISRESTTERRIPRAAGYNSASFTRPVRTPLLVALLIGASPAFAQAKVDPAIHKLCIEAKDYAGCVRAMKGESLPASRVINSQGADISEGNQCPKGAAYVGGGNCQQVECEYTSSTAVRSLGHDQLIAGLKDNKGKDVWGCPFKFWMGAGRLRLSGAILRTTVNPDCPLVEPKPGFNSSCQTAAQDFEPAARKAAREALEGPKCDLKLQAYKCSFSAYLDANPAVKEWAEMNPGLAQQERIRMRAVD